MYQRKDHYYWKAKEENLPSRAAYKLEEINKRYHIISSGMRVLDLGCAPGGWSYVALKKVGRHGRVVGVDVDRPVIEAENFTFIEGDLFEGDTWEKVKEVEKRAFHVILSDVAPKTSGISFRDVAMSIAMCEEIIRKAEDFLICGGSCVMKVFEGEGFAEFKNSLRKVFQKVKPYRPRASRSSSREVYLILQGFLKGREG